MLGAKPFIERRPSQQLKPVSKPQVVVIPELFRPLLDLGQGIMVWLPFIAIYAHGPDILGQV